MAIRQVNPRIGYVVKRYPRYSETFIVNEILAHEQAGCQIEIFSLNPPLETHFQDILARVKAPVNYLPQIEAKGLDFWVVLEEAAEIVPEIWQRLSKAGGEFTLNVYQALILAREVRLRNIRHLHAHFGTSAASVARLAAHFSGITYSFTAHAKDIFHEAVSAYELRDKLDAAAFAVTISEFNLRYLKRHYGRAGENARRIYNGLDLALFPYRPARKEGRAIVTVGRLVEKKGFIDLIEACAILAKEGRDFECAIIGSGPLEQQLRARIEELGLARQVRLIGNLSQYEVRARVQEANVFAAPCVVGNDGNQDGLPMVILEAMSLGVPCVSTDVSGIPEAVRDNQTGIIVPQHSPEELAAAITRLLDDYELRAKLSRQARALIEEQFDISRTSAQLRELFYSAIQGSRQTDLGKG